MLGILIIVNSCTKVLATDCKTGETNSEINESKETVKKIAKFGAILISFAIPTYFASREISGYYKARKIFCENKSAPELLALLRESGIVFDSFQLYVFNKTNRLAKDLGGFELTEDKSIGVSSSGYEKVAKFTEKIVIEKVESLIGARNLKYENLSEILGILESSGVRFLKVSEQNSIHFKVSNIIWKKLPYGVPQITIFTGESGLPVLFGKGVLQLFVSGVSDSVLNFERVIIDFAHLQESVEDHKFPLALNDDTKRHLLEEINLKVARFSSLRLILDEDNKKMIICPKSVDNLKNFHEIYKSKNFLEFLINLRKKNKIESEGCMEIVKFTEKFNLDRKFVVVGVPLELECVQEENKFRLKISKKSLCDLAQKIKSSAGNRKLEKLNKELSSLKTLEADIEIVEGFINHLVEILNNLNVGIGVYCYDEANKEIKLDIEETVANLCKLIRISNMSMKSIDDLLKLKRIILTNEHSIQINDSLREGKYPFTFKQDQSFESVKKDVAVTAFGELFSEENIREEHFFQTVPGFLEKFEALPEDCITAMCEQANRSLNGNSAGLFKVVFVSSPAGKRLKIEICEEKMFELLSSEEKEKILELLFKKTFNKSEAEEFNKKINEYSRNLKINFLEVKIEISGDICKISPDFDRMYSAIETEIARLVSSGELGDFLEGRIKPLCFLMTEDFKELLVGLISGNAKKFGMKCTSDFDLISTFAP
jgi:hypothetical protein